MSICIAIRENELEAVCEALEGQGFVFKCLFDSSNMEGYLEDLGIELDWDVNLFSRSYSTIANNRMNKTSPEKSPGWQKVIQDIFNEEMHLSIVNSYTQHNKLVLIFSNKVFNRAKQKRESAVMLKDNELDVLINEFNSEMLNKEGMRIYTFSEYKSGINIDPENDEIEFKQRQKALISYERKSFTSDLYNKFEEAFKFRLITYYCKISQYSLDDVMIELRKLNVLDERFDGEIYIYEEEAKRLLARRLCTLSFKNDIKLLMDNGIIPRNKLTYDIGINE